MHRRQACDFRGTSRSTHRSKIHGLCAGKGASLTHFCSAFRVFVLDSDEEQCCELKGAPSRTSSSKPWNMTEGFIFVSPNRICSDGQALQVNAAYSKVLLCPSNASYMMKGRSVPFTNASTSARTTLGGTLEVFEQCLARSSPRQS